MRRRTKGAGERVAARAASVATAAGWAVSCTTTRGAQSQRGPGPQVSAVGARHHTCWGLSEDFGIERTSLQDERTVVVCMIYQSGVWQSPEQLEACSSALARHTAVSRNRGAPCHRHWGCTRRCRHSGCWPMGSPRPSMAGPVVLSTTTFVNGKDYPGYSL